MSLGVFTRPVLGKPVDANEVRGNDNALRDAVNDLEAEIDALTTAVDSKVTGPASATDNAIVRFDGTTGKLVQNSLVTISDGGAVTLPAGQGLTADQIDANVFENRAVGGSLVFRTDGAGTVVLQTNNTTRVTIGATEMTTTYRVNIDTADGLRVQGTQVVGAQGATISDPTGGTVQDSEARTAISTIIDRLQAHGLIA